MKKTTAEKYNGISEIILDNANILPEKIAIVDQGGNRKTTWKELCTLICQIANYAVQSGLSGVVPVVQGRTMEYIATVLGLNLAGLAVSPLTKNHPIARIEHIKQDLGADIIADEAFVKCAKKLPAASFSSRCKREGIAWVIYTSGSTGKPKGVIYTNIGIYSVCMRFVTVNEINRETVSMATASMGFCASIVDIYTPLCGGGTVHLASEECCKDKSLLEQYLLEQEISHAYISPRMLSKMHLELPKMKIVSTAGERVSRLSPRSYKIHVFYGMTETITSATLFVLDRAYDNTPIGKPLQGLDIYLLDEAGEPSDEGEICITGSLAAGYWNLPELTRRVFTENPFSDDPEHNILLHTGDIGKRMPDGNLLFINRNDGMIKINGQRVELGEVEFQIKAIDGVTEAAVKGFTNAHGQVYLCAWYTADEAVTEDDVKARLSSTLVAYMVPAFIIKIDAFPLNINGKLDRNALTAPDASDFRAVFEAPENDMEKALCEGFQAILGVGSIGRNDDFFSLGGDSILVVSLCAELEKYGAKSADIFKGRTPKGIAALLGTKYEVKEHSYKDGEESYPLTAGQTGVYYACINQPESLMYNIPFACKLPAETDGERLRGAIEKVLHSFSAFGTCFQVIDGEARMMKRPAYVDIRSLTACEADMADIKKHFVRPFDMETGELARFLLVKTELALHLIADIHHIIFDGSSVGVFFKAIAKAYAGEDIPSETVSIFEVACLEKDDATTEAVKKAEAFFEENISKNDLDGALASDHPENDKNTVGVGKTVESDFDEVVDSTQMERFARKHGITEATVFTGAFAWALSKLSGNEGFRFCVVDNGRRTHALYDTVGMLVRTLPLSVSIDEALSASAYLCPLGELFYDTMEHYIYPFFKLSEKFGVDNDTMLAYQADMLNNFDFCGTDVELELLDTGYALSKLSAQILKTDGGYKTAITYRSDLYSKSKIQTLISLMKSAVSGFLKNMMLKDIPLADHASIRLLDSFHGENTEYEPCSVVHLLRTAMKQYPDNIAVVTDKTKLTYRELDEATDRLASYLVKRGIGKGNTVAILSDRDEMMAICPIAVIKAGAMYQPLDSTYPVDRLTYMVKDSGAKLLITPKKLRHLVEADVEAFFTEDIEVLPECDTALPSPDCNNAFVILYTSGSTGNPKGCVLEHGNLTAYIRYFTKAFCLTSEAKVSAYASFGFDASMQDVFPTLCAGATVYVIPLDVRLDLERLNRYFEENGITHALMTTQVGRQFAISADNHSLKYLIIGGEMLVPLEPPSHYMLINAYGPTETTIIVTFYHINRFNHSIPIGRANENTALYIVDEYFRRVPVGVPGELCIAGPQVSRGYLNLPEKTAEVFIDNPFADDPKYKKMYRTGDIVCFLPDGNLQFVGRKDSQVKIRGFRIELTEVEEVIRRFEGISDATVVAFDDSNGGKFLAAYVVSDQKVNIDKLNDFIRLEKPSYMIPAVTMQIDEIPLTQNQKVNKKALPKPERRTADTTPPQNEVQQEIFDLAVDFLEYRDIGIHTDLFDAGLNSISSIKLISILSSAFDRPLSMAKLKENNTVEKLEALLTAQKQEESFEIRDEYPLTKTQEGIFYECMNKPESTFYNVPYLIRIGHGIDIEKLKNAIVDAVNAHPYLMTTLFFSNEGVRCRRDGNARFYVSDIEEMTVDSTEGAGKKLCRPFALQGGRLFRIALIYSCDSTLLFIDVHHSIFDGASLLLFMEDISRAYEGNTLETEVYSGYEAALHEQALRKTEALDKAKKHYSELFADFGGMSLPLGDHPNEIGYSSYKSDLQSLSVHEIERFCGEARTTKKAMFTAAFGFLLAKYRGEERSVFATVCNGRTDSRFARSIAMYVKTFPVICHADKLSIYDYVRETARQIDDSRLHGIYSFAEMHRDLGINSDIMFVYQDYGFDHKTFCGEEYAVQEVGIDNEKAPFTIIVILKDATICVSAEYDASRYSRGYVKHFIEAYERVLIEMTAKNMLDDIVLVDDRAQALLETFHGVNTEYEPCSVVHLLRTAMKRYPDNIAVVSGKTKLTYRELDEATDRLASYLVKQGIGKEDVVAILLDRNEMMAICPIAVIKAGAMYQPLDSTYPVDRLTYMVKDSGAKLLITPKKLRHLVETDIEAFFTEDIDALPECDTVLPSPEYNDALVILYTSGSTGSPKGCVLEHKNFAQFLRFYNDRFGIDSMSGVAAYASFGFDASVMDLFTTFCAGAVLYIIPADMRLELNRLNRYFEENNITHSFMTTQIGRQFAVSVDNHSLKHLLLGGEALTSIAPPENYTVVNGYGPTETTCAISVFDVDRFYSSVPLGKPNSGVKAYVVDKKIRRVPVGVPGELCIAGPQVSRGYLNLPEKTAEVFIDNPFTDDPRYKKMYRTGDIVCFLPDGNLQFVGRKDSQVKIRGFRIELTEVEEVIRRFEGISDATVVAFDDSNGGKFLAAYVVSDQKVNIDKLNDFIRLEKPSYMIPAVAMQIDEIPLTQNQKVNKKALPKPTISLSRDYVPPKNDAEKDFCEIMGGTLSIEKYSAEDNFFEVGGSSISATKVLVSAMAKGYSVAYADLFRYQSPCAIAEYIKSKQASDTKAKKDDAIAQYDYSAIHALIQKASIQSVDEAICHDPSIRSGKLGNVLLTGVTGFLGMHILREYITCYTGTVTCLIRKNARFSAKSRLKSLLFFYFSNDYVEAFEQGRIVCIEASLNDEDLSNKLRNIEFDTVIHCAACVKHFASNDILYQINTEGTKNILRVCEERKKRFIHISTSSVSGVLQKGMDSERLSENELYIGQRIDNEYVRTKYLAERYVLEAALRGVDVKILRLGNLMGRLSDGIFQINFSSNGFVRDIRGVTTLGYSSADRLDKEVDISPIDCTAEAVLKIADSDLPVFIYHAYNTNFVRASELIEMFEECGFPMKIVSEEEYKRQITLAAQKYKDDAYMSDIIGGLVAYKDAETGAEPKMVDISNMFTAQILSRLGFTWPKLEKPYFRKMMEYLIDFYFFDTSEQ